MRYGISYIALIALLAGATILTASIIYDYVDYYSKVNNQVIDWYGTTCKERVLKSSSDTQSLVMYRVLYNIKYWKAYLVDFAGLGGIAVTEPVTLPVAISILKIGNVNLNVYSTLPNDAAIAANGASINGGGIYHSAHIENGKILNKPHYHPTNTGTKLESHSFFGL